MLKTGRNKGDKYFEGNKKIQTLMKHEILDKVLGASIGIANFRSKGFFETYTYIDLFAGNGGFSVNSVGVEEVVKRKDLWGSPLIALNSIAKFRNRKVKFKKLKHFRVVLVEKDPKYAKTLSEVINTYKAYYGLNWIGVEILKGEWDKYMEKLKEEIGSSTWGFIFADPYSIELNYGKFIELLKGVSKLKDVLLFLNFGYIRRFSDDSRKGALHNIIEAFGIPKDKIESFISSPTDRKMDEILTHVFRHIGLIKSRYIAGMSLPIETFEKGVVNQDYFFLVMGTDSIGVMNGFLEAYKSVSEKVLAERFSSDLLMHRNQQALPFYQEPMEEIIVGALEKCKKIMLNDFFSLIWRQRPILWTSVKAKGTRMIPTVTVIVSMLNDLYAKRRLDYVIDNESIREKVFYKNKSRRKGIKPNLVKREDVAKQISIRFFG